ncbi:hypothetical protein [Desulfuromonas sp. CSMB_57]|jgi:hypothetical protein|uniref:hypothetical protein n=1 Tax=Desulfuromonas sp. CSMB_57 TaxID=2807629 RepID=UPI001CD5E4D0|nr:hypothetical protein [Desulfuromonas sp. CSMB_57]
MVLKFFSLWLLVLGLLACAATPSPPEHLDPEFASVAPCKVVLSGVSFDKRYQPAPQSDLSRLLLARLQRALADQGYQVLPPRQQPAGPERFAALTRLPAERLLELAGSDGDAVLAVHVDFLFQSENYRERNPPPLFEIAAEARLVALRDGRELWRDKAGSLVGGGAAGPLPDPVLDRLQGVDLLVARLLRSLPPADLKCP